MPKAKKNVPFNQVITALLDNNSPFSPTYLHRFSDITPEDLTELKKAWPQVTSDRRAAVLEDLEELAESDTLVNFDDFSRSVLDDANPRARAAAIRLLWECEDTRLVPTFIRLMEKDDDLVVRASAATALGLFIYLGELEEISDTVLKKVEESLLTTVASQEPALVRRRALESLGFSSRPEVPAIIEKAYDDGDKEWQASALFAMGRSADSRWERPVLDKLEDTETDVQLEAVRAAGALELESARQDLLELLASDTETDEEITAAAIWSLSQIGGGNVRDALEALLDHTDDDDLAEYIEQALDNLNFTEEFPEFSMLDFDPQEKDKLDQIIDLAEEDEDDDEDKLSGNEHLN
ncbi:MAG: HEAT repeat domain-containing protein [Anaerolineaceae bacterium]|nr:HEAT repeat domain-containing protein [Anaerolineaceae bacterium]